MILPLLPVRRALCGTLFTASLFAQGEPMAVPPIATGAFDRADAVVFDRCSDGSVWAAAGDYKLHVAADRWQFLARPLASAPTRPVAFALQSVQVGGLQLRIAEATPQLVGTQVACDRGATTELLEVRRDGVEQSFRFDRLPRRGALTVELAVTTELVASTSDSGVDFTGPGVGVHLGKAIAIDANGATVPATTTLRDGILSIAVPAEFVATATLPLLIDPLVSSSVVHTHTYELGRPDLAWDETNQLWMACWQRVFSATDTDLFAVRLNAQMQPIGSTIGIDLTGESWERPQIANNGLADDFLVVAQVSNDSASPYWIGGRIVDAAGTMLPPLVIEKAGVPGHLGGDKLHPDVGGDPSLTPPTYFTVVWERDYATNDHDIHCKQVTTTGALRSASPTLVDNDVTDALQPSISKSDGPGPASAQRWAITYMDQPRLGGAALRAAFVTWDGLVAPVQGHPNFLVDSSGFGDTNADPVVSSPTAGPGPRQFLIASDDAGKIQFDLIDANGTVLADTHLHTLLGVATMPIQATPSIDGDGTRFTVAWSQMAGNLDTDGACCLIAPTANGLRIDEGPLPFAASNALDRQPAVASRYAGSGTASTFYGLLEHRWSNADSKILAWSYDGVASGGITVRSAGCGGLTTLVTGRPAAGTTLSLQLSNANGLGGFVCGSALPTLILPTCPQCTIGVAGSTLFTTQLDIVVPWNAGIVGAALTVQGFGLSGGTCYGSVRIGDAIDIVVQ